MYWLRKGAQPTDQAASLMDRAGLIRRTGPSSLRGEWEFRVPRDSGPDAPEGWSYDGPHKVTWNNKPKVYRINGWAKRTPAEVKASPLIERYGFRGYKKIPLDNDALKEPIAGSDVSAVFPNTYLPM